jgi:tryptophan synthase alpha chain
MVTPLMILSDFSSNMLYFNNLQNLKPTIMNRLEKLFTAKKKNILSIYFTAGYPGLNDTSSIITELVKADVDMIEIGMPFSDPVADGPVIQRSSEIALKNGMSLRLLFEQLTRIREKTDIPLILMGYINPVFKFGIEEFLVKCSETGIDGTIIPDLPVDEYLESYESMFKQYNIHNIFLITPQTPNERIAYLDSISKGFLYMVSTAAITGATNQFNESQISYFEILNNMNLRTPRLIGFGISDKKTYNQACQYSNGVIIGSAFIKSLDSKGHLAEKIAGFIKTIR